MTTDFDVLLTHGYFLSEDEKEQSIMRPYPPLGLMYLSAYLKDRGWRVKLFDATFEVRENLDRMLEQSPGGIIGVYTVLMTRKSVLEIIAKAKQHQWTVILGGPESANHSEAYLRRGADFVVAGEGEQTLTELLTRLKNGGGEYEKIRGIRYLDGERNLVRTPERPPIEDIDALPRPDRGAFDIAAYMDAWQGHHNTSSVSLITARGCPYRCIWCSHAVFGYSHRKRDARDCADELAAIVDAYHPEQVWYADDVFTINKKWLFQYAEELGKRGLKVPFETISRADCLTDPRVMDTLMEMGCYRIWIGAESLSQPILDRMRRNVTVEQVRCSARLAQERGIQAGFFIMWGCPGETVEDIDETVARVAEINPDVFFTTLAYPVKGTEFFRMNMDRIHLDIPWEEASDRDYRITGRPDFQFYRCADRYIRAFVDAARLASSDQAAARGRKQEADEARNRMIELAGTRHDN